MNFERWAWFFSIIGSILIAQFCVQTGGTAWLLFGAFVARDFEQIFRRADARESK